MLPSNPQHPRFSMWQEYARIRKECRIRRRAINMARAWDSDIDPDHHGRKLHEARVKAATLRKAIYAR